MSGFGTSIENFGMRVAFFVLVGCLVVLIVGIIARFIFVDARKESRGSGANPNPWVPPSGPLGLGGGRQQIPAPEVRREAL
jgi:hypothetical protein